MTDYIRVAMVASANTPGTQYEVKTDGQQLTCPCNGWTRRTHYAGCAQFNGNTCDCNARALAGRYTGARDKRTCRHVREVEVRVAPLGGLRAVIRLLDRGVDLDVPELPVLPHIAPQRAVDPIKREVADLCARFFGNTSGPAGFSHALEVSIRKFAGGVPATVGEFVPPARPDWLGGGRAILLRD